MVFAILTLSCASGFVMWEGPAEWQFNDAFVNVETTKPHGTLRVTRTHAYMFVILDGKHIFLDRRSGEVILRVSPGLPYMDVKFLGGFVNAALEEPIPVPITIGGGALVDIRFDFHAPEEGMTVNLNLLDAPPSPVPAPRPRPPI